MGKRFGSGGTRRCALAMVAASGVALMLGVTAATASNDPAYRDCAFANGLDPDFVELYGGAPGSGHALTVPHTKSTLKLEASESSFPLDNLQHVTLTATVKTAHVQPKTRAGSGTGKAIIRVPLAHHVPGRRYTISWAATFDNGGHACPSRSTPFNTTAIPFHVRVRGSL